MYVYMKIERFSCLQLCFEQLQKLPNMHAFLASNVCTYVCVARRQNANSENSNIDWLIKSKIWWNKLNIFAVCRQQVGTKSQYT